MRRSIISIVVIVVILAAAWTGGWFWLAGWADARATEALRELSDQGIDVDCTNRVVGGFPFALRISCADTAVAERTTETKADLAAVTGGASVLAPMTVTIDMASPARVASARLVEPAEMRWEGAAVNVGMGMNGPRDVTFVTEKLDAAFAVRDIPVGKVTAASAQGSLAPSDGGGTSGTFVFSDLRLSVDGKELPPMTGIVSGELSVPPRALLAGRAGMQAPIAARGINIALESGGARFKADGEMTVDGEGIVDGNLVFKIAGVEALPAFIAALPEDWRKIGNAVAGGLLMFGKPTTLDGQPASELTLEIERGSASIGPMIEFDLPRVPI
jgi:hypothetical protein